MNIEVGQLWTNGIRTIKITQVTKYNVVFDVVAGEDVDDHYMSKVNLVIGYRQV